MNVAKPVIHSRKCLAAAIDLLGSSFSDARSSID